jgi:hypothetical protein
MWPKRKLTPPLTFISCRKRERSVILGFADIWVFWAYVLTLAATLGCIIYGWLNWHKEGDEDLPVAPEDVAWAEEEEKIEETLG